MSYMNPTKSTLFKLPIYLIIAIFLNIAIFILIQKLVSKDLSFDRNNININLVDFIRLKDSPEPIADNRDTDELEPPEIEDEPPPPEMPEPEVENPVQNQLDMTMPSLNIPLSISGTPYLGDFAKNTRASTINNTNLRPKISLNVKPTLRVPPVYPPRALRSGIEGVVTVEFTITIDGSVKDAVIVKGKPPKIFDKAVLNAISKWKFNPDKVDGKPIEKRARQDIKFTLQR